MRTRCRRWMFHLVALSLAACSGSFSGTYQDSMGVTSYEFQRNGTARISALGSTVTGEYTLDGDKILLSSPQGTVVLTRKGDRLYGPMGMELLRQPEG